MQIALWCLIFSVSLAALLVSADVFTNNSEKLGRILKIPQFIIGITIVSIGTSIPELLTGVVSVLKGEPQFVAANILGSNIANILLFIGISTLVLKKIDFNKDGIGHDFLILGAVTAMTVLMLLDSKIVMYEAILLFSAYIGYGVYKYTTRASWKEKLEEITSKEIFSWKIPTLIILGGVGVYLGANYTIESILKLAEITKLNSTFLIYSAVALGTSLPEITVSLVTAIKGNFSMSLGNIFGSNFFNTTIVFGITGLMQDIPVTASTFGIAIPFLIVATYIFTTSAAHKKSFSLDEGVVCLAIYGIFITQLFFAS